MDLPKFSGRNATRVGQPGVDIEARFPHRLAGVGRDEGRQGAAIEGCCRGIPDKSILDALADHRPYRAGILLRYLCGNFEETEVPMTLPEVVGARQVSGV